MKFLRSIIGIIFILMLWQAVVYIENLPSYILPSPYQVLQALLQNKAILWHQTWPTAVESMLGLFFAALIGIFSAVLFSFFPTIRLWFLPSILISQALPTFAIAPMLVLWLGYGMTSKIVTIMMMLFFPITTTFYDGLSQLPSGWMDLAYTLRAKPFRAWFYICLPAALPALASGLRLAAIAAPLGAIIGEWVGASRGLGYLMLNANARLEIALMFAALICLIFLALILFYLVNRGMQWLVAKYSAL